MLTMFKRKICNKKGAILVETLTGMIIFAIISVTFAATIAAAHALTLRAQVTSNEVERVFIKMENGETFATRTPADPSENFQIILYLSDIEREKIVLADDTIVGAGIVPAGTNHVTLLRNQAFVQHEEPVAFHASPSTGAMQLYTIERQP